MRVAKQRDWLIKNATLTVMAEKLSDNNLASEFFFLIIFFSPITIDEIGTLMIVSRYQVLVMDDGEYFVEIRFHLSIFQVVTNDKRGLVGCRNKSTKDVFLTKQRPWVL